MRALDKKVFEVCLEYIQKKSPEEWNIYHHYDSNSSVIDCYERADAKEHVGRITIRDTVPKIDWKSDDNFKRFMEEHLDKLFKTLYD